MPCYRPLTAFRDHAGGLFFHEKAGTNAFKLPCGQCIGCRKDRMRMWATRIMHEASLYDENCFVTLTYRDAPVSLRYSDFQGFMKRLRESRFQQLLRRFPDEDEKLLRKAASVRYFVCGEYGEKSGRAHFHACLFGFNPPDLGDRYGSIRRSLYLDAIWGHGHVGVGTLTYKSAQYVAGYVLKKVTGRAATDHYATGKVDPVTGEMEMRVPEFCRMSLKPGIGAGWLEKFHGDVFPGGSVVVRGKELKSPRYYDKRYKKVDPMGYEAMKFLRWYKAREGPAWENSKSRLKVRETVAAAAQRLNSRKEI